MQKIKKTCIMLCFLALLLVLFLSSNAEASPSLTFIDPTPDDNDFQTNNFVEINVSIREENLTRVLYNWSGVNYTIYNESLVLMINFDNQNSLGENYGSEDSTVVDLSVHENNGTTKNSLGSSWNSGKYNGAFDFDGNDDTIDFGSQSLLQITGDLTVECWAKYDSLGSSNTMISQGTSTDDGESDPYNMLYILRLKSNKVVSLFWEYGDGYNVDVTSTSIPDVSSQEWHHYAAVRNASTKKVFFYVDGKQLGNEVSYSQNPEDGSSGVFTIGSEYQTWSYPIGYYNCFNGAIDEVRVWDRCLRSDEIYQEYASNLNKSNQTNWYLYVNQSKNSAEELDDGAYIYQAFATDTSSNTNSTEQRTVYVNVEPTPPVPEAPTFILFGLGTLFFIAIITKKGGVDSE